MANAQLSAVLRQAREMADTQDPTDAELIDRFIAGRDEAAFAALLERHGPMVLSVCRRVLLRWVMSAAGSAIPLRP